MKETEHLRNLMEAIDSSSNRHIGKRVKIKMADGKLWKFGSGDPTGNGTKGQMGTVKDVEKVHNASRGWTDTYKLYFTVELDDGRVGKWPREAIYLPRG